MTEALYSEKPAFATDFASAGEESQLLWSALAAPRDLQHFYTSWLALLAAKGGAERQLLLVGLSPDKVYRPLAFWPEDGALPEALTEVVEQVIDEACGLVLDLDGAAGNRYAVAYPVQVDDVMQFVVAAEVTAVDEVTLAASMERLQWGSAWLEAMSRRLADRESRWKMERMTLATDLLAQVLDEDGFDDAAMALVTGLAHQLECDRVSLGLKIGDHLKVKALSHSARFGEKMNLVRAIEAAMDEAVLQNRDLVHPRQADVEEALICRDHEHLAKSFGATSILTVPLFSGDHYYGAITLERTGDQAFSAEEVGICRELAALAGAALQEKWQNDRLLVIKMRDAAAKQLKRLFGPKYIGRKLVAIGLVVLILCCALIVGDYRLSSDTVLEGAVQRMVVSPYNGYIADAIARAGDVVNEGDILCRLDDRDLRLERLNWLSQHSQLQKQRQEALAKHDRAQVNILSAQLGQAEAQLELVGSKIERTLLKAPYQGLVTSGDLTQRLGGAVQQGEVLFEVAPLNEYRVILKVDERRIADVQVGQTGELVLTSIPEENFPFTVSKVTPITTAEEGLNYFRVEAQLARNNDSLRPGMEGVGKIMVDRRNLFAVWTRDLREWFTLWVWSWWP
jgi:multidrug resistance efflux pump